MINDDKDIWDKEFRKEIYISKTKLRDQILRYGGPIRFYLGKVKTRQELEEDRKDGKMGITLNTKRLTNLIL
jgi:hypothetical protein